MENDLSKLLFTTFLTLTVLLGGCDAKTKLDQQSTEIFRLNTLINQQYGTRAADLEFAERQVAVYQGCTFLFNVCSTDTLAAGERFIKNGFTGSSSWWWVAFIGKLTGVAAFIGTVLWLPWHLYVLLTRPAQAEVDEAREIISSRIENVKAANRHRTQALQQASSAKRDFERLSAALTERQDHLDATELAISQAEAKLISTNSELAKVTRIKNSFREF